MSGKLTSHVLDTGRGRPAAGMAVQLWRVEPKGDVLVREAVTNADGRTDSPLVEGAAFAAGTYRLVFAVGDYFASQRDADARRFLDAVPLVFRVDDASRNYHVPLLVSPWSYSTYRGS
ncbi:MAG: hydroxyisourate hydrolase [Lentisphaerae bacterium]|nr:hydroxyisourate hydrolase [Lentisphaerota bacterium]